MMNVMRGKQSSTPDKEVKNVYYICLKRACCGREAGTKLSLCLARGQELGSIRRRCNYTQGQLQLLLNVYGFWL